MEAVARQFAQGRKTLVLRNGWFSYRWSQIFDMGHIPAEQTVLKARPLAPGRQVAFTPAPIDEVVAAIRTQRPDLVFAPHVETAAGIMLPDAYLRTVADAVHEVGGLIVLDCIASGAMWVDMQATGVDILISAPQKGWSGSPCCAFVMLSERARSAIDTTTSTSFAADLKKWLQIMEAYEGGGHAYHATMPTDALTRTRDVMLETRAYGFEKLRAEQADLGRRVRALLAAKGLRSVAAAGFEAPGVVVSYTDDAGLHTGKAFLGEGLQTAAGVPLQCDEPADFKTFRIGLFGLDKLQHIERTVAQLDTALGHILKVNTAQPLAA
jgi:aspartate aminotransferase-like enzyme